MAPTFGRGGGMAAPSAIVAVDRSTDGKLLWKQLSTEVVLPQRPARWAGRPAVDAGSSYGIEKDPVCRSIAPNNCVPALVISAEGGSETGFDHGFHHSVPNVNLSGNVSTPLFALESYEGERSRIRVQVIARRCVLRRGFAGDAVKARGSLYG